MHSALALSVAAALLASQVGAFNLDQKSEQSIKDGAKLLAANVMSYYDGGHDPSKVGMLTGTDYYWWSSGGTWGNMINYASRTGDIQYNKELAAAVYSQISPTEDYMMMDKATQLGSDDQAFWALTAIEAAEENFPVPDGAPENIWLTTAANAFDDLIGRWNTSFCGGGIKWQFIPANNGFKYKSSIANGATMQLGARLALHTKNQTYADKAAMIWDWMENVGYISDKFQVFDGAGDDPDNCTKIDFHEWSYNSGALIGATAALANFTARNGNQDAQKWADRAVGLWKHSLDNFYMDNVIYEQACEDVDTCDLDQKAFKSYYVKWSVMAGKLVPYMMCDIQAKLATSATAVAAACTGSGSNGQGQGNGCGTKWYKPGFNGVHSGEGETMSGMNVILALLSNQYCDSNLEQKMIIGKAADPSSASAPAASSQAASSSSAAGATSQASLVTTQPLPAISSAVAAALSAGVAPSLVSQAVYAVQSLASVDPQASTTASINAQVIASVMAPLASAVTDQAAASSAIVYAVTANISPQPAPSSATLASIDTTCSEEEKKTTTSSICTEEEKTTTSAAPISRKPSDIGYGATAPSSPIPSSSAASSSSASPSSTGQVSTTATAPKTSSTLGPSSGLYSATNSTKPAPSTSTYGHPPVNSITTGEASGFKIASWALLAVPVVLMAFA